MNNLEAWQNKKRYKHLVYSVFMYFNKKDVEPQGIEPWSKHIRHKPSTCLVLHYLSEKGRGKTNQPDP